MENKQRSTRRKAALVAGVVLAATVAGTVPSWAEGSWSSYMSNWTNGAESRRWQDNHSDGNATTIGFSGCNFGGAGAVNITLYRAVDYWPDDAQGMKFMDCGTTSWGAMSIAGSYYFAYGGNHTINVNNVVVKY
ncbi:hypothetical protein [Streptomyces noursei]|uniref:Uncharacterized protein n=1 Tax=Streptomyces noursei TaxID=1971 RepID=A0A401RD43_STRNR|nr:hypothetical protein [Streptomyces noursei]EXU89296.1 hypothetical protein P354_23585 [Streptomyces noursei PD-1]MCZ0972333.1 hypothetical protein [Streptomyces noursei]UWS76148.1 hypothetical protein N1H47_35875 [Streptomyces noursei]GCB95532.1 hypothetical protein SALB_08338 [Streptomyces noursei]